MPLLVVDLELNPSGDRLVNVYPWVIAKTSFPDHLHRRFSLSVSLPLLNDNPEINGLNSIFVIQLTLLKVHSKVYNG